MEEKSNFQSKYGSSIQNGRDDFLDKLSNSAMKSPSPNKNKKHYGLGFGKSKGQEDSKNDEKTDQVKNEPIKYEKYKSLNEELALWYTAQDQLSKGMNPQLCTKYGIRLNAPKEMGNRILRMVTEFRRHTDLMTARDKFDPCSINPEDDEDADEGDLVEVDSYSKISHSAKNYKETAPRHHPVKYNESGIK